MLCDKPGEKFKKKRDFYFFFGVFTIKLLFSCLHSIFRVLNGIETLEQIIKNTILNVHPQMRNR